MKRYSISVSKTDRPVIGAIVTVDFPELGLFDVPARVDTGAAKTVLHCVKIHEVGSPPQLEFQPLDRDQDSIRKPEFADHKVRSSNGVLSHRYYIKTPIRLAGREHKIKLSLANRAEMTYPVLIGRNLLNRKYIVDVSHVDPAVVETDKEEL